MAKVTIEIDEKYAGVLSLTAIGSHGLQTNVAVAAIETNRYTLVSINETGNVEKIIMQEQTSESQSNGDRIRAMSDEQLVDLIYKSGVDVGFCINKEECEAALECDKDIPEENCKKCLMEWIKRTEGKGALPHN